MANISNPKELEQRQLQCKFTLQSGEFKQGFNTKIVLNNTINAVVSKSMNNNFTNSAQITVYGMNYSDIAALSTLGYLPLKYELNKVQLYAQYASQPTSLCFEGFIVKAWANFSDPSRPMYFECQTTYQDAIDSKNSTNIKGKTSINDLLGNLSSQLKLSLQNNGVEGTLNNTILTGSFIQQLQQLSKQGNFNCVIDKGKLYVSPKGKSFSDQILSLNKDSGLLSYPMIDAYGVKFRMRYNPVLDIGQYVSLQTKVPLPKSNGKWYVYDMQHSLNNRHENWYTDIKAAYNNQMIGA